MDPSLATTPKQIMPTQPHLCALSLPRRKLRLTTCKVPLRKLWHPREQQQNCLSCSGTQQRSSRSCSLSSKSFLSCAATQPGVRSGMPVCFTPRAVSAVSAMSSASPGQFNPLAVNGQHQAAVTSTWIKQKCQSGCRCVGTLHMAVMQCKRGKARDKDGSSCSPPLMPPESTAAHAPAAVVGLEAAKLADQVLEHVQEREQKVWALQLDARDLRSQLDDKRTSTSAAQAQCLVVRPL
jgi:hypothetical protein